MKSFITSIDIFIISIGYLICYTLLVSRKRKTSWKTADSLMNMKSILWVCRVWGSTCPGRTWHVTMFREVHVKADTWSYIFYLFIMLEINFISDSSQPTFFCFFFENIIGSWLNPDAVLSDWCSHFGPFLIYLYYLRPLAFLI